MESDEYKVRLEIFEGPLDLLLYLIKKDEIDIHDVTIERITGQYLAYIDTFRMLNIDLASEFVVMAANLMYLKSRTLLPRQEQPPDDEADEDDPRWELIRQLVEYKKFKDAAGFLVNCEEDQLDLFVHRPDPPAPDLSAPAELAPATIFDLIRAFQKVLKRFEESHEFTDIVDDRFTVADKLDHLLNNVQPGSWSRFDELFAVATTRSEVIVTFLALLELMKMNEFEVSQRGTFGEIQILRKERNSSPATETIPA